MMYTMYSNNLTVVCSMKTLTNALGFSFTVFITQMQDAQVASQTMQTLIIRKGKLFVSKIVEKSKCETAITIANKTVARRKNCFWPFVI